MNKKLFYFIALFGIILLAFFLRSKMILSGDFYYLVDQARDMLLAKSVVIDHKITLIGARAGLGGLFHGPLWIYMIAPFFILAKGNPFFTLTPLFELVSLGTVIVGFFVGYKLYGRWMGLLLAALLCICATFVQTVPYTTNAQVLPIIFLCYLYAMVMFLRKDEKFFALAIFLIGLGFQFESAFAVLLFPLTVFAVILRKKLPMLRYITIGIIGFIGAVGTFILFDLRHKFLMLHSFISIFSNPVKPLPGYEQYAHIGFRVQDRVSTLWNSLLTPLFDPQPLTNLLLILILVIAILLLLKKVIMKKIQTKDKEYIFILFSPVIIFGVYVLYPLPLWPHYLLPVAALSCVILALSIQRIWIHTYLKIFVGIFLFLAFLPAFIYMKNNYLFASAFATTSDGSYKNQLQAAQWVIADAKGQQYGYFAYTPGILTYNMDYLLWWVNYKNHTKIPTSTKQPLTYLLMAPTQENDKNAHEYWKQHVLHTSGEVLVQKRFSSGIIVEKLHISPDEPPVDPNYYQNLIFR